MKLYKLLNGISFKLLQGDLMTEISALSMNSKECLKNSLFFAVNGTKVDGNDFINEAIQNGARAIVIESELKPTDIGEDVAIIWVDSVRTSIGLISKNYYSPNGYNFKIIGITGTNGKTTTSFMIGSALMKSGNIVCVVGTSGIFINGRQLKGEALTTPDPIELQSLFGFLNSLGVDYVVMEVSAHALALDKTSGIVFDYGIFSNLTEDHLDFFKTMEKYGNAKFKLFDPAKCRLSIININDKFGEKIAKMLDGLAVTYGEKASDYMIDKISNKTFKLIHNNRVKKINLNISGLYNFYNATSTIVVLLNEGLSWKFVKKHFKNLDMIEGRYNEFVVRGHGKVVLDFAHTPDGLEKLLINVRENMKNTGKIISVFGCGGNRDRDKRPLMGEISGRLADHTIISIDNPRFESADSVMADIEVGLKKQTRNYEIVMPRIDAIKKAIRMSGENDVVVISGKGTEPYYEVNGVKEFYREDIVIDCIKKRIERE